MIYLAINRSYFFISASPYRTLIATKKTQVIGFLDILHNFLPSGSARRLEAAVAALPDY